MLPIFSSSLTFDDLLRAIDGTWHLVVHLAGLWALAWWAARGLDALCCHFTNRTRRKTAMSGYGNRVITIDCSDLAETYPDDHPEHPGEPVERLFVAMRNPGLMAPEELAPQGIVLDENGQPTDMQAAEQGGYEVMAKLIIGWRLYPGDFEVDPETGEPLDQELIPLPATPEKIKKLPTAVSSRIMKKITAAVNPQ